MAKKIVGIVTSDVQDKTIVVTATRRVTHPVYGKQRTKSDKFMAHDAANEAHVGDRVEISEIAPMSKNKTWKLDRIIETGHGKIELVEEAV